MWLHRARSGHGRGRLAASAKSPKPGSVKVALGDTLRDHHARGLPPTPLRVRDRPCSPAWGAARAEAWRACALGPPRLPRPQKPAQPVGLAGAVAARWFTGQVPGRPGAASLAAVAATGPGGGCRGLGVSRAGCPGPGVESVAGVGATRARGSAGLAGGGSACRGQSPQSGVGWPGAGLGGRRPDGRIMGPGPDGGSGVGGRIREPGVRAGRAVLAGLRMGACPSPPRCPPTRYACGRWPRLGVGVRLSGR